MFCVCLDRKNLGNELQKQLHEVYIRPLPKICNVLNAKFCICWPQKLSSVPHFKK